MDLKIFKSFEQECSKHLASEINNILKQTAGNKPCAIGFITTDDFYGFYLTWEYTTNIYEYFEWGNGLYPGFLYNPVVDIIDSCKDIDLCNPSDEKWNFAKSLLAVLDKSIKQIPDEIFQNNQYNKEDILFFATMSDGDYMQEMIDASIKMFNTSKTLNRYGLIK